MAFIEASKTGSVADTDAEHITYDNTESGLESDNVQGAIDEIKEDVDELNDNLSGFKFYPSGTSIVGLISDDSAYTDEDGNYVVWGTATAEQLVEDNPNTYKSVPSEEDCRGEVGADSATPFSNGLVNACIAFSGYDGGGMGSILIDEDGESTFASGTQSDQNDAFEVVYSGSGGYFRYIYAKKVGKVRVINSSNNTDTIINVTTANQLIGTLQGDHWSPNPKYGAIMAIYV